MQEEQEEEEEEEGRDALGQERRWMDSILQNGWVLLHERASAASEGREGRGVPSSFLRFFVCLSAKTEMKLQPSESV